MSEASQRTGPDLHAIFGIDSDQDGESAHTVEIDHAAEIEVESATETDLTVEIDAAAPSEQWTGVTGPSRRGSSPRFLTDVIVDLGLVAREQVESAIETSRGTGTMPERVLLDSGALTQDGLTRALAERYGFDHLDLGVFSVDMNAANLVSSTAAKRYQAVPVAFAEEGTLLLAMADPSNVLAVDDIAIMTGYEVRVAVAPPEDIANLISRLDRLDDVVSEHDGQIEEQEQGERRGRRPARDRR